MQRRELLFLLCVLLSLGAVARDGGGSYFGARAGADLTFPSGSENTYGTGAGFLIGAIYHQQMARRLFVEPGIYFSYTSMSNRMPFSFDGHMFNGAAHVSTLRIPVYIGYSFAATNNLDIDLATGPTLNVNLSARQGFDPNFELAKPIPDATIDMFSHGWKRVDGLWGIRLSLTFANSYFVGISSGVSFTPLAVYGNKDKKIKIHRNSVAITVGYNF